MPRIDDGGGISRIRQAATPKFLGPTELTPAARGPLGKGYAPSVLNLFGQMQQKQLGLPSFDIQQTQLALGGGDGGGFPPPPPPWNVNLKIPESQFRQFFIQNAPWYNPLTSLRQGQVQGLNPQIANQILVMNALLPFLGKEDQSTIARTIAMMTGGSKGPFAAYLQAAGLESPIRQQLGDRSRLEDALAVARLFKDPALRTLAEGSLGLGLSTLGAGAGVGAGLPVGPLKNIRLPGPDDESAIHPQIPPFLGIGIGGSGGIGILPRQPIPRPGTEREPLGPQDIVSRSRANQMSFLSQLAGLTGGQGPGSAISPLLDILLNPSLNRPLPGQLLRGPGGGFDVAINPAFLTG